LLSWPTYPEMIHVRPWSNGRIIGIAAAGFYRLDALAVIQPTALNHWRKQCGWGFVIYVMYTNVITPSVWFGGSMVWQCIKWVYVEQFNRWNT